MHETCSAPLYKGGRWPDSWLPTDHDHRTFPTAMGFVPFPTLELTPSLAACSSVATPPSRPLTPKLSHPQPKVKRERPLGSPYPSSSLLRDEPSTSTSASASAKPKPATKKVKLMKRNGWSPLPFLTRGKLRGWRIWLTLLVCAGRERKPVHQAPQAVHQAA